MTKNDTPQKKRVMPDQIRHPEINNMKTNLKVIISIIFIIFVFAFLRFSNIYSVPVFVDEAIYVRWSQVMRSEASLRFLPMSDGKQPLFMWASMPIFKLISDPLVAARTLSALCGLGTMVGLSVLSFLFFQSTLVSLLTALLYAVIPFTVFFDRMALADSMLAMFGVWVLVFFKLFLDKRSHDFAMLTGFALGAALLTKSPAIFYFVWLGLVAIFTIDIKTENKKTILNLLLGFFYILVISLAMRSILKLGPNSNMAGQRNLDYLYTVSEVFTHPLSPLIGNLKTTVNWLWLLLTPAVFVSMFIFTGKQNKKTLLLLFFLSLVPLLSQAAVAKVYTSRYILFTITPLLIIAANNLVKLNKYLVCLILLSAAVTSIKYIYAPTKVNMPYDMTTGYYQEWTAGWGQKQVSDYLINLHNQGKKIVVFTEGFFGTMPDGIQIYTQSYSNLTVVGSHPIVEKIPEGLLSTSEDNERFLVVNKSRNKLPEADLAKLELIAQYPKHQRADGTTESLQFYRLR